jgi:hypothetical protein
MTGDGAEWLIGLPAGWDAVLRMTAVLGLAWGLHLLLVAANLRRRVVSVVFGALVVAAFGGFELVYAETDSETGQAGRTIRFPPDRSVGKLSLARQDESNWYPYLRPVCWVYWGNWGWEYLCEAKGDVTVPAGAKVQLTLGADGAGDLSWVADLPANDLHALAVYSSRLSGTKFGDADLQHLSALTGLKELVLSDSRVSDRGLRSIEAFSSLRLLWLNSPRVGNAGLAHLAKLKSLETLSLQGGRWSDKGLAHLGHRQRSRPGAGAPRAPAFLAVPLGGRKGIRRHSPGPSQGRDVVEGPAHPGDQRDGRGVGAPVESDTA